MDFAKLIQDESAKLQGLHVAIHRTVALRDRNERLRLEWEAACKAFHSYVSALDPYLEHACAEKCYSDPELLEFAICFLELDAWFFRSGYLKQVMITRLKRTVPHEAAKARLRRVLADAVNRRGTREFKYYCRLAAVVADRHLVEELEAAKQGHDPARVRRASMMLDHIRQATRSTLTDARSA